MKVYAVYLFDDNKQGMERHSYLEDVESKLPEHTAQRYYEEKIKYDEDVKVTTLDMRITINNIKYASQTVAYIPNNGGKAIVLAERIK